MNTSLKSILVLALATFVESTIVQQCVNSDVPLPLNVDIIGCEGSPCDLPKNTNIVARVTFDALEDIEILKPEIFAKAIGVELNFPLEESDGCKAMIGPQCPLEEGARATYELVMPVKSYYPPINVHLTFNLYAGEEKKSIACFEVDGKVV